MKGARWAVLEAVGGKPTRRVCAMFSGKLSSPARAARAAQALSNVLGKSVVLGNPTLVHHGMIRRASHHVLQDPPGAQVPFPVADLYAMHTRDAERVAQAIADALGIRLMLMDNADMPAQLHEHPTRSVAPKRRNPAASAALPSIGEKYQGPSGLAKVVQLEKSRVRLQDLDTGTREWVDLLEFRSVWKMPSGLRPRPRVNPQGDRWAIFDGKYLLEEGEAKTYPNLGHVRTFTATGRRGAVYGALLYPDGRFHWVNVSGRGSSVPFDLAQVSPARFAQYPKTNPSRSARARAKRTGHRAALSGINRKTRRASLKAIRRSAFPGNAAQTLHYLHSSQARKARRNPRGHDPQLDEAVKRIRAGLRRRSGRAWTVTRGRGSVYGWIYVGTPSGSLTTAEQHELATLLDVPTVHHQGVRIPSGSNERAEYVARAEGGVIGNPAPYRLQWQRAGEGWRAATGIGDYYVTPQRAQTHEQVMSGSRDRPAGKILFYSVQLNTYAKNAQGYHWTDLGGKPSLPQAKAVAVADWSGRTSGNPSRSPEAWQRRRLTRGKGRGIPRKAYRALQAKQYAKHASYEDRSLARSDARDERARAALASGRTPNPRQQVMPGAGLHDYSPAHPERTTYKNHGGTDFDITVKEWPSVGAMRTALEMQGRRASRFDDWKPWPSRRTPNPSGRFVAAYSNTASGKRLAEDFAKRIGGKVSRNRHREYVVSLTQNPKRRVAATHKREVRGKARRNPRESEMSRARRTFSRWQDRPVTPHARRVRRPSSPTVLAKLGDLQSIVYESDKYDGEAKLYEHRFSRPRPVLAADPDGREMHIVGGRYSITADGLKH